MKTSLVNKSCMHRLYVIFYYVPLFYRSNCICITNESCAALAAAFNSNPSNLIDLDLSENQLRDPGVTEISTLLGNSQCTLQILRFELSSFKHDSM